MVVTGVLTVPQVPLFTAQYIVDVVVRLPGLYVWVVIPVDKPSLYHRYEYVPVPHVPVAVKIPGLVL